MNELYSLFIKMRYIDAEDVAFAPHTTKPISVKTAALFGLDKDVVDLMQMVPYYAGSGPNWNFGSDGGEFLYGGEFDFDMRDEKEADWWLKCVDPLYYLSLGDDPTKKAIGWVSMYDKAGSGEEDSDQDDDSGDGNPVGDDGLKLYHRPWHVTLDRLGNHKAVLFVNTRTMKLSETDQESGNACHFIHDAIPYLEDIIAKFQSLEYIPGGLYEYLYDDREYRAFKEMYIQAGWPESLDVEKFFDLMDEFFVAEHDYNIAQTPLCQLRSWVSNMKSTERHRLEYNHIAPYMAALPADADPEKRRIFEQMLKSTGEWWAPPYFAQWKEKRLRYAEENKAYLEERKALGDSDDDLKVTYRIIEENMLESQLESWDDFEWRECEERRQAALKVPESVKARFVEESYDDEVPGLMPPLTREDVRKAGMEQYLDGQKLWNKRGEWGSLPMSWLQD